MTEHHGRRAIGQESERWVALDTAWLPRGGGWLPGRLPFAVVVSVADLSAMAVPDARLELVEAEPRDRPMGAAEPLIGDMPLWIPIEDFRLMAMLSVDRFRRAPGLCAAHVDAGGMAAIVLRATLPGAGQQAGGTIPLFAGREIGWDEANRIRVGEDPAADTEQPAPSPRRRKKSLVIK